MKKLKIGITCYPTLGGSGVIATELGKKLAKKGHDIHFITSSVPFRLDMLLPNVFFHEVEMSHYPVFQYPPYDLVLANKMAEVIDEEQLDILHVHYAVPHAICAILAKAIAKRDVKIVTTLHGTDITVLGIDNGLRKMIIHAIEESDVVTAVSQSLVDQTREMLDVASPIDVVYNFVDEEVYQPTDVRDIREQFGIKEDEKVLVHISNFRKVKRVQDVVQVFSYVQEKLPAKLMLIGDGPEYSDILRDVQQRGLEDKVLFLGKQNNVAALLNMADIMLLPSEKESFGLVLLEAMACGVPCIGTDVGGIPEVIQHGKNGFISQLGDVEQMGAFALDLLTDEKLWQRFSEASIRYAEKNFHSDQIVAQYEAIYEEVLQ
ncbi:N-acetyl-alpha-D-glucosaminyl L-malate synthase BshA [Terribacillus saccharophilus]|uniref:N-acetyl-alpha-D-glucosaminyl L-malate synthase BshA n=1 Tax=Terribacillus saccharophilus TaxID=361277 RepID=A0AAX2EBG3_9BACI|nr:N-acetyl-alpha-D-glucosaminyl L-malate synthase BshA [Terribacillus saccharophilus]MEC0290398.1 N-acetyl-alpha-D-glucosaminyl L-malate synthase BshA [Terribacillus saccharophilus]SEM63028.1 N-acetyl-alpha-D-glucosaminyl L-malate synthase BshA [Terribacillus saccharophilus]